MNISPVSKKIQSSLQDKIDQKTKPIGALGVLEKVALQIGLIQNTLEPSISNPAIIVFAGDHGIVTSKPVSPYPQEVTEQMVLNFLNGGAAINVFCKQHQIKMNVVDAGVNADFEKHPMLINAKINKGTRDYSQEPAMTNEECVQAMKKGSLIVENKYNKGTNTIGFGEMGIGNTSSASLLMSHFTQTSIDECAGRGTGLNDEGLENKVAVLREVIHLHQNSIKSPLEALACYGGYEIAMMCGAIIRAASLGMTILIDGFIVTSALLVAHTLHPEILDYCIFSHTSGEKGHEKMLSHLKAKPLLNLGLRLGEGTGAAIAFPLIMSSIHFLNEMATFKSANVSEA